MKTLNTINFVTACASIPMWVLVVIICAIGADSQHPNSSMLALGSLLLWGGISVNFTGFVVGIVTSVKELTWMSLTSMILHGSMMLVIFGLMLIGMATS